MNNNKKAIIYLAQCTVKKDLMYIGKTHQSNLDERIEQHNNAARNADSTAFHRAMVDYGIKNWEWSILERCNIEDEFIKEEEWIKKLGAISIDLLNITHKNKISSNKSKNFTNKIIERTIGKSVPTYKKSELGNKFLRTSGKIKPVINLKTKKRYISITEAAKTENISRSTIRLSCKTGKMLPDRTRYAYLDLEDKPILEFGHKNEHYIGENKKIKKVKNLINGKIYKNCTEAAKEYNVTSGTIGGAALGKYQTVQEKYVFCYLDENDQEIIEENHRKGIKKIKEKDIIKYVAWHIDDVNMKHLRYFKTINELCYTLAIKNNGHVKSVCDGKRHHAENWRIAYFDSNKNNPILKPKHEEKVRKRLRKIICLNDNKIFNGGAEAGKYYGLNSSQITKCADGGAKSVFKEKERLRFAFLDDNGEPILKEKHKESLSWKGRKRIKLLKTGEEFQSLAEFCRKTGVGQKRARNYLKNPSIDLLGFEFIEID